MAKIITIAHQKGGVGKSTLTLNLAHNFSKNVQTAVVDFDPQGTIASLASLITEFNILNFSSIEELRNSDYKVVFIDTPPYLIEKVEKIFTFSDFILIPTKVGVPDINAIKKTVQYVKIAKKNNPNLKAAIVLNMVKPNVKIKELALDQLKLYDLPLLSSIYDRISYANSFLEGGVNNTNDKNAIKEIEVLTNEILDLL